jgi:hypothetical protein
VILESPRLDLEALARETGWEIKPEGACKADVCVPLRGADPQDAEAMAAALSMPLVRDEPHGLWALGPESGGRALNRADLPDMVLPTWQGDDFDFRSLRGQKIFLLAWASW